jgi:hypothetical protein
VPAPSPAPESAARPISEPAAEKEEPDDHDRFIRHIGITYFDIANLPIATLVTTTVGGTGAVTGVVGTGTVAAPVIGVRYWMQRNVGLDLGVGVGWSSASTSSQVSGNSMSTDQPSPFGIAFHAGLPIAVAHGKHYSFLVVPETTAGFTSETIKNPGVPDTDMSGVLFNIGARAGADIHFGFIGIPQLALQASLGLFFAYRQETTSTSGTNDSFSATQMSLSTSVGPNPWAIFTNNVSATYYL